MENSLVLFILLMESTYKYLFFFSLYHFPIKSILIFIETCFFLAHLKIPIYFFRLSSLCKIKITLNIQPVLSYEIKKNKMLIHHFRCSSNKSKTPFFVGLFNEKEKFLTSIAISSMQKRRKIKGITRFMRIKNC